MPEIEICDNDEDIIGDYRAERDVADRAKDFIEKNNDKGVVREEGDWRERMLVGNFKGSNINFMS